MRNRLSVGIWAYGACSERYVGEGYKNPLPFEQRLQELARHQDVTGVELNYPNEVNDTNTDEIKYKLSELGLSLSALNVELVCERQWSSGSITSPDENIRALALERCKAAMQAAKKMDCGILNLWLGLDGFDYVFEADYAEAWDLLVHSLRELALSCPEVKLSLEYKISEPKMRCYINSSGKALALAQACNCDNVGVTLDFGHSLNANENPAEAAAFLLRNKRLFHVHFNDNYSLADDDMPAGTSHWPQFFEFIWWLKRLNYAGWISIDIYPYRDDANAAIKVCSQFLEMAEAVSDQMVADFYNGSKAKSSSLLRLLQLFRKGGVF